MNSHRGIRITGSRKISPNPVILNQVIVTPDSDAKGDVTVYDGESSGDPEMITIRTGSGSTKGLKFVPPIVTERGLYISFGSNVEEVFVQYSAIREKGF